MAIGTPLDIGTGQNIVNGVSSVTLTTSATVPAGDRIIMGIGTWKTATPPDISSIAGGSLTWVEDVDRTNDSNRVWIWSAHAPAGLASSTVITVTFASTCDNPLCAAIAVTGLKGGSSGYVHITGGGNSAGGTAWTSGNTTTTARCLIFAVGWGDGGGEANTPTSPAVEVHEMQFDAPAFVTYVDEYRIENAGTYAIAGTWGAALTGTTVPLVAYDEEPAPGGVSNADYSKFPKAKLARV